MSAASMLAVTSAWMLGILFTAAAWPRERSLRADLILVLPIGWGVGCGITSTTFYLAARFSSAPVVPALAVELLLAVVCAWTITRRTSARATDSISGEAQPLAWIVAAIAVQIAVVALVVAQRRYLTSPHGAWDGWAIWNMHARMIHRGGAEWTELFALPQLAWTHLDYPLLVPASVARAWALAGSETTLASGLISVGFGAASVGLLIATAARLRTGVIGGIAGITLLSTPFFVTFSAEQHADIPLAFYLLCALSCVVLARDRGDATRFLLLGGMAAGFAAWTKNEGLLMAVVLAIAVSILFWRRGTRRESLAAMSGLAIALVGLVVFKSSDAPGNDIVSASLGQRWRHVFDLERHATILRALARDIFAFGEWRIAPYLPMLAISVVIGFRRWTRDEWLLPLTLLGILGGYYAVYLITPWNLGWHLDTSLVRLLLHLWPSAILAWCLGLRSPPAVFSIAAGKRRWWLASFVGANLVIASLIFFGLQRQLAIDELDAQTISGRSIRVAASEGWYAREHYQRDVWFWSAGASSLEIRAERAPVRVGLRFAMRGLEPQTVTIAVGGTVLWRGEVPEQLTPVEIPSVALEAERTRIELTSTSRGRLESDAPNARRLAFALYNLTLVEPQKRRGESTAPPE